MKKYIGWGHKPNVAGPADVYVMELGTTRLLQHHVRHSVDGFSWGPQRSHSDRLGVGMVQLEMAIGTNEREPFRVSLDFPDGGTTVTLDAPIVLFRSVGVMKLKGYETPIVAATLARASKGDAQAFPLLAFIFPETNFAAADAQSPIPLGSDVGEELSTIATMPRWLNVHRTALMVRIEGFDSTTLGATLFHDASLTKGAFPVSPIIDANAATGTVKGRVRFHEHSPYGYYTIVQSQFQPLNNGSGPADLALSLLWDVLGEEPMPALYQRFKVEIVAEWPMEETACWAMTDAGIRKWIADTEAHMEHLLSYSQGR